MLKSNRDKRLTTVRLDPDHYKEFKILCMEQGFTFQKLASNCIYLFLTDKEFRTKVIKAIPKPLPNREL